MAYIERDRVLRTSIDPYDTVDSTPGGSGIKYTWGYDEVRAAACSAGRRRRLETPVAVVDTGADVTTWSWRAHRAAPMTPHQKKAVTDQVGHGTFVSGLISAVDGNGIGGKGVAGQHQAARDPGLAGRRLHRE